MNHIIKPGMTEACTDPAVTCQTCWYDNIAAIIGPQPAAQLEKSYMEGPSCNFTYPWDGLKLFSLLLDAPQM